MNAATAQRTARWLLAFIVLLMLYGSLQPFRLRHVEFGSPLDLVWRLRWGVAPLGDLVVNVALYLPFGIALAWVLPERWPAAARVATATLLGFTMSLAVEVAQWFIVTRFASLADVTMNTVGSCAGCAAGVGVRAAAARLGRSERLRVLAEPAAAGLAFAWVGSFLPAWLPRFAPRAWPAEWAAHLAAGWPAWPPVAMQALGWLIAGALVRALTRADLVWRVLAVLALAVLGVRFTWFVHAAGNAELVGAVLALALWPLAARLPPRALLWLLGAALALGLAYRGLAPFAFGSRTRALHWVPFTDLISHSSTGFNLPLLFGKAFTYGSLVWLPVAAGAPAIRSALLAALFVLAIEILQLYTAGGEHVATLTDPATALCAGFVLLLLRPASPGGR
jgi:glycopeptide antibiotics resistance protein